MPSLSHGRQSSGSSAKGMISKPDAAPNLYIEEGIPLMQSFYLTLQMSTDVRKVAWHRKSLFCLILLGTFNVKSSSQQSLGMACPTTPPE